MNTTLLENEPIFQNPMKCGILTLPIERGEELLARDFPVKQLAQDLLQLVDKAHHFGFQVLLSLPEELLLVLKISILVTSHRQTLDKATPMNDRKPFTLFSLLDQVTSCWSSKPIESLEIKQALLFKHPPILVFLNPTKDPYHFYYERFYSTIQIFLQEQEINELLKEKYEF